MSDEYDPVAELRRIANWLDNHDLRGTEHAVHQIAELVVKRPPFISEVINHLGTGGDVETWTPGGGWTDSRLSASYLRSVLERLGDQLAHGYRLVPPEPATERVRLDQVIGRRLNTVMPKIRYVTWNEAMHRWEAAAEPGEWHWWLNIDNNGTVEVLREGDNQ